MAENYRRAFSTLGCAELDLGGVLDLAARHEVAGVELRALSGSVDLVGKLAERFGTPGRFASFVAGQGVRIEALDTSFRLIGGGAAERDALLAYLPWAEAAGVSHLRVFDGGLSGDPGELGEARSTLDWWRRERARRGTAVELIVETHDLLADPAALRRFVSEEPEARLLWDSHHTWRKGGEVPEVTWQAVRASTVHIHVKDSVTDAAARLGYRYVLPGQGEFPMPALRRVLERDGFAGPLSLEWERLWHAELGPLADALGEANRSGWW